MSILVRDPVIDRHIRLLASQWNCTLQEAVGRAVAAQIADQATRAERIDAATRKFQDKIAALPKTDDGLTHKEFFDREYGDI
jgi:hypothetical protein